MHSPCHDMGGKLPRHKKAQVINADEHIISPQSSVQSMRNGAVARLPHVEARS